ncbi:MAG: glutathione S-transferase domain-containing protein, partial [Candidatus Thermoplasmatota archaeon]|nr:glutathione S-transferase domain-containing protein [Candidatus Thermoplasmatota archaeon]
AAWAEATVPEPTLYPGEQAGRVGGRCRVIEHWAHTLVEDATWQWAVVDAADRFEDADERWRFVEFQERRFGDLDLHAKKREALWQGVLEVCELAEGMLADQAFLLGDAPSLADLALYGGLHPLVFVDQGVPKEHAGLQAWWQRVDAL